MYEWYQEYYVGAAHGLAGIYYFLMQVRGVGGDTLTGASWLDWQGQKTGAPAPFFILSTPASPSL